jgi:RNA polymerase-interacting CarD/CdnL/TRCF family regulator
LTELVSIMKNTCGFRVGEKIIDSDHIYLVYEIKNQKISASESREYLCYKPLTASSGPRMTASIPTSNAQKAGLRKLMSKSEVDAFMKIIKKTEPLEIIDYKIYKDILCLNDPVKTLPLLKALWLKKKEMNETFSRADQEILETIMTHLINEFSYVTKSEADVVRKKLQQNLSA